jgi:broad specificity phosphatase PhoE/predicted kinase
MSCETQNKQKQIHIVFVRHIGTFTMEDRIDVDAELQYWTDRVLFVMVGLPARGKSYLGNKIVSYLKWMGVQAKLFNVGKFRRAKLANPPALTRQNSVRQSADFFKSDNVEAKKMRDELAFLVLDDLLDWMKNKNGQVAVFDATNTTQERRNQVWGKCKKFSEHINVIFLESIVTDQKVIKEGMLEKISNSPDYQNMTKEEAMADLEKRLKNYEDVYQTIDSDDKPYIKLMNLQSKVICNLIRGTHAHTIASFLMSCHVGKRPIWLLRAGATHSRSNHVENSGVAGLPLSQVLSVSSEEPLSDVGIEFSKGIRKYLESTIVSPWNIENLVIYSSVHRRALETSSIVSQGILKSRKPRPISALNMLDAGVFQGMTVDEFKAKDPKEFEKFMADPFKYRFPGGESMHDVSNRLAAFVKELERHHSPVVVISHLMTLKVLYGYFVSCPADHLYKIELPQNCIIKLTPSKYGWIEERAIIKPNEEFEIIESKSCHGINFYGENKE